MSSVEWTIAQALHHSGCLKFGSFRIKSGAISPYYVDLGNAFSSPTDLCTIIDIAAARIAGLIKEQRVDKIASIELKGALFLVSIACKLNLPCVIVRKESKTYGATGRIVGARVNPGERVLFFDDVISEGSSKLDGIKPIETLGAKVEHIMVAVNREQGGKEYLEDLGYHLHELATISSIVDNLLATGNITRDQAETVRNYANK